MYFSKNKYYTTQYSLQLAIRLFSYTYIEKVSALYAKVKKNSSNKYIFKLRKQNLFI